MIYCRKISEERPFKFQGQTSKILLMVSVLFLCSASSAFAQYVPVQDDELISKFEDYAKSFDNYSANFDDYVANFNETLGDRSPNGTTESLRDLIAGSDPQLAQLGKTCAIEPTKMTPIGSSDGPWAKAAKASADNKQITGEKIPDINSFPAVQINKSKSLSCLLQDIVQWQKLSSSIQIHALLKSQISDAQNKQLQNQLANKIVAANLNWAKAAQEINDNGVITTEPAWITNYGKQAEKQNTRVQAKLIDQAIADPKANDPQGSLALCRPGAMQAAAKLARKFRTDNPENFIAQSTQCSTDDPTTGAFKTQQAAADFVNGDTSGTTRGYTPALWDVLSDPSASPMGTDMLLETEAMRRQEESEKELAAQNSGNSYDSIKECEGTASDPHCTKQTIIDPSSSVGSRINNSQGAGLRQIENAPTSDAGAAKPAQEQTNQLDEGGLAGFDTSYLKDSTNQVNDLVQEFYGVIENGYFNVNRQTTNWAQATMLMIYDEMKFKQNSPDTTLPNGSSKETDGSTSDPGVDAPYRGFDFSFGTTES